MTQEERLIAAVRASPSLMGVLQGVRALRLPDWRLVSGCVYQTVWNAVTAPPENVLRVARSSAVPQGR